MNETGQPPQSLSQEAERLAKELHEKRAEEAWERLKDYGKTVLEDIIKARGGKNPSQYEILAFAGTSLPIVLNQIADPKLHHCIQYIAGILIEFEIQESLKRDDLNQKRIITNQATLYDSKGNPVSSPSNQNALLPQQRERENSSPSSQKDGR